MTYERASALVVLGLVLFASLSTANVVLAADRTVLDAAYAAETADEANLDEQIAAELEAELRENADVDAEEVPIDISVEEIVEAAVTEEHVAAELEANLDRVYAYLNGETDELRLEVDAVPVKENAVAYVEAELAELGPADVDDEFGAEVEAMAENETEFYEQRAAFEAEVKERIQAETSRELSDEELDSAYDDRRDEIRDDLKAEADERIDEAVRDGDLPEAFAAPARDLAAARIDALTGAIEYDAYVDRVDAAMADVRAAGVDAFAAELDAQVPDTVSLTDELDEESTAQLERTRSAVGAANLLAVALPAIALATAGLIVWVGPPSLAAIAIGAVSATAGLAGLAGARLGRRFVPGAVADAPSTVETFLDLFLRGALSALGWQSGVALVAGLVLVGVGVAIRRDLVLPDVD